MNAGDAIALAIVSIPAALVLFAFWFDLRDCQRCPDGRAHDWTPPRPSIAGWSLVKCGHCGREDIT